jgi:hypothetical protein
VIDQGEYKPFGFGLGKSIILEYIDTILDVKRRITEGLREQ